MAIMICDSCKKDRLVTDFINNQKFCYYCEYRKKLQKTTEKRTVSLMFCRICSHEIIHIENLKKRKRTVFCSQECAQIGYQQTRENHWTRKLRGRRVL